MQFPPPDACFTLDGVLAVEDGDRLWVVDPDLLAIGSDARPATGAMALPTHASARCAVSRIPFKPVSVPQ